MAISFPSNPSDNQKYTYNGKSYVYVAARGVWINAGTSTNIVVPASGTETQFTATTLLPASAEGTNLGTSAQPFGELYLSANSIYLGETVLNASKVLNVDTNVTPETLALQVQSDGAGHAPDWEWTWEQSALPFARRAITNQVQTTVPLYQQGTYQINNFANTQYGSMTQTHAFKLKWIEGAGDDNLVDWVTTTEVTHSHPDINGGADTTVQRLAFTIPETITLPTLTAPSVTYTVTNNGAGAYTFSGTASGDNPDIGPFYRGGTYTVNITATGHPFYFTTDNGTGFEAGSYVGEYTSGVTGSRTESGTITFVVPSDAPDTLYYQCGNHSVMRGAITVKDLEVETNENGNYIIYGQHSQEAHAQRIEIRPLPELSSQMCIVYDGTTGKWQPQDLATYVENTPSFENKIKEVAGTATLVAPDGTSLVASVEIYSTDSYLPQLGNTNGDIAFVEDTQELKIWKTGSGWLDVTAASTGGGGGGGAGSPTVTGVTPANYDGTDQTTFTITGTNFDVGTYVDFITADGTEYRASQTQIVTQGEITAITPQAFLESDGPLDIKVTTNAGATVTAPDMIQTGGSPVWTTAAGTLYENAFPDDVTAGDNSYRVEMGVNETLVATDPDGQPVTYSVESGSLPPSTTLNALTGNISGTLPADIGGDTTYSFVGGATDSSGNLTTRNFNIIVKNTPGSLYSFSNFTFTAGSNTRTGRDAAASSVIRGSYTTQNWMDATFSNYGAGLIIHASSGQQQWLVPAAATYRITVQGAAGGGGTGSYGGVGSFVTADVFLNAGTYLSMYCGNMGSTTGSSGGGGGGGGTFVFSTTTRTVTTDDILLVGGGGGGGSHASVSENGHGMPGSLTRDGTANRTGSRVGGQNGLGGGTNTAPGNWGGADGAGLLGDGVYNCRTGGTENGGSKGLKFVGGGLQGGNAGTSYGAVGGFGGGAGGSWAPGGAGGYSGGAGDFSSGSGPGSTDDSPNGGGGGGLYHHNSNFSYTNVTTGTPSSATAGYVSVTRL